MSSTPVTRRGTALAAALLSTSLVLTACGGDGDDTGDKAAAETHSVKAENGTVKIPADPRRIVTIGNTNLPFIDLGGKPVGVTEVSDSELDVLPQEQKTAYEAAEVVGSDGGEVDLEKLAALKPDLILVQFHSNDWGKVGKRLESIAPTVYWGLDTEWKAFADEIGKAGNVTDELGRQKAEFKEKVGKIKETYRKTIADTSFVDVSRGDWSDPGTFYIADIGCSEIARDDIGLDLPEAAEGKEPLAYESLPFEQIGELSEYGVITYPVDAEGRPTEPFVPVTKTNTWKALPAVSSGRALGLFCPGNNSYGPVLRYLDSLDRALATLPPQ
ncbi:MULTISPECIES: ABC transporter substrate-binding protein [Streptomyces]|uniref:ABC transporter substrate-binding protein n=1 Tax=Streptomyces koelreuteriae TaxID=2838015 RepID=A0ABX8FKV9_9ACTN|nr:MULTISPECIES: ABC transporter substrate-binding protein [Streptomyces]QWB21760.1 ABC transporter substrate-binding protein [Streptomyces koelreuteriae]UUA04688.1 ABC transporter substrate-binding protein [Streptomyces koelreuteriae]UUA12312.1 ABC transporter substrate-binding protein [Streptomyces sp. CRCS-T-1]